MEKNMLVKRGALNALGTAAYIALIATFMSNAEKLFGRIEDTLVGPFLFLLLFVVSATITGALVLGKPAMLFVSGERDSGVRLFLYTLLFLVVLALVGFGTLAVLANLP